MRLWRVRDEELTAARVGPVEGHADRATQIGTLVQLVAAGIARSSGSVSPRIAPLHDEIRYDAMNRDVVEKSFARQGDEVLDGLRRIEHRHLNLNRSPVGLDVSLRGIFGADKARRLIKLRMRNRRGAD